MCIRDSSNGDLQALYDRSDGFYRRQLVLTTKEKPVDRADDPDLAEKMKAEVEGILLWAFEGLQRLAADNFKFTESQRTRENREAVKRENNNIYDFIDSGDCLLYTSVLCKLFLGLFIVAYLALVVLCVIVGVDLMTKGDVRQGVFMFLTAAVVAVCIYIWLIRGWVKHIKEKQ